MWSGDSTEKSAGIGPESIRKTLMPLSLILTTPVVGIILSRAVTNPKHESGFLANTEDVLREMYNDGVVKTILKDAFHPMAWKIIGVYMATQLLLMRILPGKTFIGPTSPKGNVPIYTDNCVLCYLASFALFFAGIHFELFNGGIAFDYFPQLISSMNIFALLFCGMLYFKGIHSPSSSDCGSSGNAVFDYYWGTELYPRILGFDVKVFTNCRYGMTGWALLCTSFVFAQQERHGYATNSIMVSAALQVIYLFKFHYWETGYYKTIDIMHDRAGYYICWGCLVWVPSLYTAHTAFLVLQPHQFSTTAAWGQFIFGLASILLNYSVDRQRQLFRDNNKIKIWGKPAEYLVASYKTSDGKQHQSQLIYSGWWGVARKINYFFELCAAFSWSMIPVHPHHLIPYFYFTFLLILLVDRAFRDDHRCKDKYGEKWTEYCKKVPYMLIPGIY